MGDSDGCPGNGDSVKPFPFSANEVALMGEGEGRACATEVVTKSFTKSGGARKTGLLVTLLRSNVCPLL